MLQLARLAPRTLGDSAKLVADFLLRQQADNGAFVDREGKPDLYYTVFGIEGLVALQAQPNLPTLLDYLDRRGSGDELDFVHLCCLVRCWAAIRDLGAKRQTQLTEAILERIEKHRSADGGYNAIAGSAEGTAYAAFLALGAWQDAGLTPPNPLAVVQSLKFLETTDGAWMNERRGRSGLTTTTAAAVGLLRQLQVPINPRVGEWLLTCAHPQGGFKASPQAPVPDLLSTATALFALTSLEVDLSRVKEPCLDFIDSLWTNAGSFHGHWHEDTLDTEYTYYGLLALGCLSV